MGSDDDGGMRPCVTGNRQAAAGAAAAPGGLTYSGDKVRAVAASLLEELCKVGPVGLLQCQLLIDHLNKSFADGFDLDPPDADDLIAREKALALVVIESMVENDTLTVLPGAAAGAEHTRMLAIKPHHPAPAPPRRLTRTSARAADKAPATTVEVRVSGLSTFPRFRLRVRRRIYRQ